MSRIRIAFFGTPDFSVPTLQTLIDDSDFEVAVVITQPDKPAGRGQKMQASPIKMLAQKHNIAVLQPEKIKASEDSFLEQLTNYGKVDFGVVIAFGQILPLKTLSFPKYGCINIHASLLPRWRGAAPIQRALLSGDTQTGVCIMQMEQGLDTGPVYSSATTAISADDNTQSLHDRLAQIGAPLLINTLKEIISSGLVAKTQSEEGVTYAQKISSADLEIKWSEPADKILLQVQTFSPKPAAFTLFDGKRFKIIKAQLVNAGSGNPGEVINVAKDSLTVKTTDAALLVSEVQMEGKKAMRVEEFLKGSGEIINKQLGV